MTCESGTVPCVPAFTIKRLHELTASLEASSVLQIFNEPGQWRSFGDAQPSLQLPKLLSSDRVALGISAFFHDSAAAIARNGKVIAAAAEERFSRLKHDRGFPFQAIKWCLSEVGIPMSEIQKVAFYEYPLRKLEREVVTWSARGKDTVPSLRAAMGTTVAEELLIEDHLREKFCFQGQLIHVSHHLSHACSSWLTSPFEEAAVVVIDGVGEWATTTTWSASRDAIVPQRQICYPHSLGLLYAAMTAYLGFAPNSDEYKVMGLAAYGRPIFRKVLEEVISFSSDGAFSLRPEFIDLLGEGGRFFTPAMVNLLGPPRNIGESLSQRHMDVAASLQAVLEDGVLGIVRTAAADTGSSQLCLAGGVLLNCVANGRVQRESPFRKIWIQPAAGDDGAAIGAALYAAPPSARSVGNCQSFSPFLGPAFSQDEINFALRSVNVPFDVLSEVELVMECASLISQNKIIGWFQGRMEFGPRALGARSILANPCSADMKQIVNARIKFREEFRPFAPAIAAEIATEYFEMRDESPFMLFALPAKAAAKVMPSVIHVNNLARVQTVTRDSNPLFHQMLQRLNSNYSIPAVLNTSFNIRGEPIVCSPTDAIKCFNVAGLDALAIGQALVRCAL